MSAKKAASARLTPVPSRTNSAPCQAANRAQKVIAVAMSSLWNPMRDIVFSKLLWTREHVHGPPVSSKHSPERQAKFRQAAFVYLHVGLLYEAAVWSLGRAGTLPETRGPMWVWLVAGALILSLVFWGLWSWQNVWFARAIWALHSLRLPPIMNAAFITEPGVLPASFYVTALVVVLINLWMLARAAWDL